MPSRDNPTGVSGADILSFPDVRWRWEAQRPQQLLTRAARDRRVIVVEEPMFEPANAHMEVDHPHANVILLRPCLPYSMAEEDTTKIQRTLLDTALRELGARLGILWYFTPLALLFSRHLRAPLVVYNCAEEASDAAPAPDAVRLLERQLLRRADLVFAEGEHQLMSKCALHPNVHPAFIAPREGVSPSMRMGHRRDPRAPDHAHSSPNEVATVRFRDYVEPGDAWWDATWTYMRELMAHAAGRIGRLADPRARALSPFADGVGTLTT